MINNKKVAEYESGLLGSLLNSSENFEKIRGLIKSSDFSSEKNQIVFQVIEDAIEKDYSLEEKVIIQILKEEKNFDKIGDKYINFLFHNSCLKSNLIKFAKSIVEASRVREVYQQVQEISKEIQTKHISANEILEKVEMQIISSARDSKIKEFKSAKTIVDEAIEELEKKLSGNIISGISTEYPKLDKITGGFKKGELIILAARPSMGKTAFALNLASNISKNNKKVAFFSIEMPGKQIINRIIGFNGYLSSNKIQNPKYMTDSDKQKFFIASNKTKKLDLYIDDSPGIKLSELIWKSKRLAKNKGLDIIFIDYLQLITVSSKRQSDNRQAEVATISRTLKKLARELEVPIVALSQLSRNVEKRESKIPMMSDIRESGAIEQDADLIAFLYRESYYKTQINQDDEKKSTNDPQRVQIIIGKNRNGPTGNVDLSFHLDLGLFLDAIKEEY